jgi:hypothetical protein
VRWRSENTVDGPRTSLSAVDERMPGTLRVSRVLPELFSSGVVLPDSVVDPPTLSPASLEVVETRRLELLTLSLQRRCSAN